MWRIPPHLATAAVHTLTTAVLAVIAVHNLATAAHLIANCSSATVILMLLPALSTLLARASGPYF